MYIYIYIYIYTYIYRNSSSSNDNASIRFTRVLVSFGTTGCLIILIISRNYNRGPVDLFGGKCMIIVRMIKCFCLFLQYGRKRMIGLYF